MPFHLITRIRWPSAAIPSVDTVGVYFVLVAFAAIGIAAASWAARLPALMAFAVIVGGLWLSQTRSAIVAAIMVGAASGVWVCGVRICRWSPIRTLLLSMIVAIGVGGIIIVFNPLHLLASGGDRSLHFRSMFAKTAVRMTATAPLLGVGVGQYEVEYPDFASPELLRSYARNNAHDYFLWIAAELGLVGLGLFSWLIAAALVDGWREVRARTNDYRLLGLLAGLVAFIVTWTVGQPLGIPQVAYTFWIALGAATSVRAGAKREVSAGRVRTAIGRIAIAAFVVFIVASVPVRARSAIATIDLSRVSYGFYDSGTTNFRWAGPRATFFVRASVRTIVIPLAALPPFMPAGAQVDIRVDGREAQKVTLPDQEWQLVTIRTPIGAGSTRPYWQVDLYVQPIAAPSNASDTDRRIAVGDLTRELLSPSGP